MSGTTYRPAEDVVMDGFACEGERMQGGWEVSQ